MLISSIQDPISEAKGILSDNVLFGQLRDDEPLALLLL
jgi:hypothetical protein